MKNMCGIESYRALLGRGNVFVVRDPARWAGLRNHGPLARTSAVAGIVMLARNAATIPPIPLQRGSARRVTVVEALKTAQRTSLAELDALFATLQHRAFQGEL